MNFQLSSKKMIEYFSQKIVSIDTVKNRYFF